MFRRLVWGCFPDLDLAVVTFGANSNSPTLNDLLNELIPRYLLPAVQEASTGWRGELPRARSE